MEAIVEERSAREKAKLQNVLIARIREAGDVLYKMLVHYGALPEERNDALRFEPVRAHLVP